MKKRLLAMFLAALLLATAVSCGDDETDGTMQPDTQEQNSQTQNNEGNKKPTGNSGNTDDKPDDSNTNPTPNENAGITLSSNDTVSLRIGQTHQIVATFTPEYDTDSKKLLYTKYDSAVITVSESGLVTAIASGSTIVTITDESGKYTKQIDVTVKTDDVPPADDNPTPDRTQYLTIFENSLYQGNLVLVNNQCKALAESAGDLLNIKQNATSAHLRVGLFKYQITSDALKALSAMADAYYAALGTDDTASFKDFLVSDAHRTPAEQQEKIDAGTDNTSVGCSDFQTGLSVYLKLYNSLTYNIGDANALAETNWIMQNYAKYGFILRYPEGKKDKTGHDASSAHFRYVGIPHAAYITENGLSLEEYLDQLKAYSINNPLKITVGDQKYSVYYVACQGASSTVPVPSFTTSVNYTVSGNNHDGFIVTVSAQWKDGAFDADLPSPNPDAGITLDQTSAELTVDDSLTLNATFIPLYENDDTTLQFVSSDPSIATVDQNGRVVAISAGVVTITVHNAEGDYSATCQITVHSKAALPNPNAGITLNKTELELKTGDSFQIIATFIPAFETDSRMLIYSASGSAITIDGKGNVFAKAVGSSTITVKSIDGKYTATCSVTVIKGLNFDAGLTLDQNQITLEEGNSTKLTATFIPKYDTDSTVLLYTSSNKSVVSVDQNGLITALKEGTATITVQNENGEFTATCEITVTAKPLVANPNAGITLEKSEITLEMGASDKIVATFIPKYEDDSTSLIYSSSNRSILEVDGVGNITAKSYGVVTVTVKNLTGEYKASCTVFIPNPNAGLTLDEIEFEMNEGENKKITATYIPLFPADDTVLTFISSDPTIATVANDGTVTAHKYGSVVITVITTDENFRAQCEITILEVADPNAGITLDKNEINMEEGDTDRLIATFIPKFDADDTTLTIVSSDPETVKIEKDGTVTALKVGSVTITVTSADGEFTAQCVVTVSAKPNPDASLTLDKEEITLDEGTNGKITATYIPKFDTDDTTLTFVSSDSDTVKVTADGTITALKPGSITITVTSANGEFKAQCLVTVNEVADPNAGITLDKEEITLEEGGTDSIVATFIPVFDADDRTLTYTSSDPETVKVEQDGTITALKAGSAIITVTNADGSFSANCSVTVLSGEDEDDTPNAGIQLEKTEYTLFTGDVLQLEASFIPEAEGDDCTLNYISTDESIVSVDENGNLTALKAGTVTIVITNGAGKYILNCTVTVNKKPNDNAGITLDKAIYEMEETKTDKIQAIFIPLYSDDSTTLIYTVDDPEIATISNDGVITALKIGTTTVTVSNEDGTYSIVCTIIVTEMSEPAPAPDPAAGITLDKSKITLHLINSPSEVIGVSVVPAFPEDDTSVYFQSSDESIVTVDEDGTLHAQKTGSATITITSGEMSATCTVIVTNLLIGEDDGGNYGTFFPYQPK